MLHETIAMFLVTSPSVINMPEHHWLLKQRLLLFRGKKCEVNVCKQEISLYHSARLSCC